MWLSETCYGGNPSPPSFKKRPTMTNLGYFKGPSNSPEACPRDASTVSISAWQRSDQFLGRTANRLGDSSLAPGPLTMSTVPWAGDVS
jgi:hypothetical protein